METIAQRIKRLRLEAEISRPELGRRMGVAIQRQEPFSGEAIRRYELGLDEPGNDARKALSLVFGKTEQYIEFGSQGKQPEEPSAADLMYARYLRVSATARNIIDLALAGPSKKAKPQSGRGLRVVRKSKRG